MSDKNYLQIDGFCHATRLQRRERIWIPNVVAETLGDSTSMR